MIGDWLRADRLISPQTLTSFGIFGALFSVLLDRRRHRRWSVSLSGVVVAFLGGATLPYGAVLLLFPYFDPQPDLKTVAIYLPVAGIALLFAGALSVWQSVPRRTPAEIGSIADAGERSPNESLQLPEAPGVPAASTPPASRLRG